MFEHGLAFDHMMMPWKFRDDMSNSSGVIALAVGSNIRTTDSHKRTLLKTIQLSLRYTLRW